jgi:hypothetical protein
MLKMNGIPLETRSVPEIHFVGVIALITGVISAIGVVLLLAMFILFVTPYKELGMQVGMLNDICVAFQYLLSIPIALALYRILSADHPLLMRIATMLGIVSMLIVFGLQLLLIFQVLAFEQQVLWVSLAMILGVGSWLAITGLVARSIGGLPNSLLMSAIAIPYIGYPAWAVWIGVQLVGW